MQAAQAFGKDASVLDGSVQKKIDKNTAKSARRMERKIAASKEEAAAAKSEKQQMGIKVNAGMVRALKAKEAASREEGMPASRAGRIAASMVAGSLKKNKTGKKKKQGTADAIAAASSAAVAKSAAGLARQGGRQLAASYHPVKSP